MTDWTRLNFLLAAIVLLAIAALIYLLSSQAAAVVGFVTAMRDLGVI